MDKNTIIGFVLIMAILVGYSWYSQPSEEAILKQQKYTDSIRTVENDRQANFDAQRIEQENEIRKDLAEKENYANTELGIFAPFATGDDKQITLENEKVKVLISTKGGSISYVELKEYKEFDKEPLILFEGKDTRTNFTFVTKDNRIAMSEDLFFTATQLNDSTVMMSLPIDNVSSIDFVYTLKANDYLVNFDIRSRNMQDKLSRRVSQLDMEWDLKIKKQERSKKFETRYAGLYYKNLGADVDYLSLSSDDEEDLPNRIQWLAYKDQFFSSILIANTHFSSVEVKSTMIAENDTTYLKECKSLLSFEFDDKGDEPTRLTYFFGPNKYKLLNGYGAKDGLDDSIELEDLIPLGWGIFGWVNKYLVIPVFNFLEQYLSNYGLIILLLTLFIKVLLLPFTYKSYISTAKMKVLRPQIDEINEKIPADKAMERQQATMALYKKVGVSPMGGCIPMLFQMPILFALFTFFPVAIELRQQAFLWATDLSSYDSIFTWTTNIPFISSYYGNHVSLFCLLMAVTNMFYTYINSNATAGSSQMPAMKWMMYLMPVMFLFIFNNYASGLSYYYFISTLFTIIQTYMFRLAVDDDRLLRKLNEQKKKPKKKSKFSERLALMQKQQLEAQKKKKK